MYNLTGLFNKNKMLIHILRNKEIRIYNELQLEQKKYILLKQKSKLLKKNVEMIKYEQKRYQIIKDSTSKDKESNNESIHYILSIFFIQIPFMKTLYILLFMLGMIDNFYKENPKELDKKIKNIISNLEKKKFEMIKTEKEITKISKKIKKLQKLLKENKQEQNSCYFSSRYILTLYSNIEPEKKLIKKN